MDKTTMLGSEYVLSDYTDSVLAYDRQGRLHCIIGFLGRDEPPRDLAFYSTSAALRERDGRSSRFVSLDSGRLFVSSFLEDASQYEIVENCRVILPSGTKSYFGVTRGPDFEEDVELTRLVFGATQEELEDVVEVVGSFLWHVPARATFSKQRVNVCDLTGCSIPREFPFVTFGGTTGDWGHVSLYGFFRLLSLFCPYAEANCWKALSDAGFADDDIARLARNAGPVGLYNPVLFPPHK